MSKVQAVLFDKNTWTTAGARDWLKKNNLQPIKRVDTTENYHRYRIRAPTFKRYTIKDLGYGIKLTIGFN